MRLNAATTFLSLLVLLTGCGSKPASNAAPSGSEVVSARTAVTTAAATTPLPTSTAVATAAASSAATSAPTSADSCVPAGTDLSPCVGKLTTLVGVKPQFEHQHPLAAAPFPDASGKKWTDEVFDVGGRQIVVVVEKRSSCPGKVEITGSLRAVSGGGAPGTKDSYQGFVVDRATLRCL